MSGTVQIGSLGHLGRFGNQLFQYACAKGYARKVGATLETNPWIGQMLFKGISDPPLSKQLPQLEIDDVPRDNRTNVCFYGYFQHSEAFDLYTLSDLREWFTFNDWVLDELKDYEPVPVAAHLRRGDYTTTYLESFAVIGVKAYEDAFVAQGFDSRHVTWVREDKPHVFKRPGLEWLIDFVTLLRADVLFRANSTFSWWAGTLGNHKVYSPVVEGKRGYQDTVPFVEGNWPRCTDQPNVHNYHIDPS